MQLEAGKGLEVLIKSCNLLLPPNAKPHLWDGKKKRKKNNNNNNPSLLHEERLRLNHGVPPLGKPHGDLSSRLRCFCNAHGSAGMDTSLIDLY